MPLSGLSRALPQHRDFLLSVRFALKATASARLRRAGGYSLLAQRKVTKRKGLPRQDKPASACRRGFFDTASMPWRRTARVHARRPPGLVDSIARSVQQKRRKARQGSTHARFQRSIKREPDAMRPKAPDVSPAAPDARKVGDPEGAAQGCAGFSATAWMPCRKIPGGGQFAGSP